jgi:GTPase
VREGAPRIAVVGRQNVGKSTLVNRLLGRREAIAHQAPGVTRDRLEIPVRWDGRSFLLVDTGGYLHRARGVERSVARQAGMAAGSAELTLLVVDATAGIQEEDAALARQLLRAPGPVLVVANKVDSEAQEPLIHEFHALGLGEPIPVSALHGRGSGDLLDRILELVPEGPQPQVEGEPRFCLVGRPNVGKSSLFNRLVREERAVVHEEPGTTRDAVDSIVDLDGHRVRFVDTAGIRRAIKTREVEYYGLLRAVRAIERSDVALLVIDSAEGLTGEDKRIGAKVAEAGRGLAVALNKWDLLPSGERAVRFKELVEDVSLFPGTPVVRTSALTGSGVHRVLPALQDVHGAWSRRIPTAEVNRVVQAALASYPPPRRLSTAKYATQVSSGPPHFVLFGMPDPGGPYRRYLENSLRRAFGFAGVPVRLSFRPRQPRPSRGEGRARRRPGR